MTPRLIWDALREPPLTALPRRIARFVYRQTARFWLRYRFAAGHFTVGAAELRRATRPRSAPRLGVTGLRGAERAAFVAALRTRFPETCAAIVAAAEDAVAHRLDILGSGLTDLGPEIDWLRDFKSGFRWEPGFATDLRSVDLRNDADVKVPWDLSRVHHFVTLGQASWLTGDERYPREVARQMRSWAALNPARGSINWANAMEAAIRIVNWLWAAALLADAPGFGSAEQDFVRARALEHGRFILENLETSPDRPASNHYLSDLVGLVYLGLLTDFAESERWLEEGLSRLLTEMGRQVLPDGVDYECSTNYHRLVTEIYASAFALCSQNGVAVPAEALASLSRMLDFTLCYTRPDGSSPLVGDADNGRLHILTPAPMDDHRHLLAFGGALLDRSELVAASSCAHEAAWWFGIAGEAEPPVPNAISQSIAMSIHGSRAFPDGGFYFLRSHDRCLLFCCTHPRGPTGHAHNDTLGFEVWAHGRAFIVDSGTYVYTASAEWRNRFRGTAAHNTVMVDDAEMCTLPSQSLFARGLETAPRVLQWDGAVVEAEHRGYTSLPGVGVHRRRIQFDGTGWLVEDVIEGTGRHHLRAFVHLAAGLRVEHTGRNVVVDDALDLWWDQGEVTVAEGWVSRSYGRKEPAPVVEVTLATELPARFTLSIVPRARRTGP